MNSVINHGDEQYRLVKLGGRWELSRWCDCLLGPHWHQLGDYRTKTGARDAIPVIEGMN